MGLEELRDRLDLGMVATDQPCRIEGSDGHYVVGELVSGYVFRDLARANGTVAARGEQQDDEADDEDAAAPDTGNDEIGENDDGPEEPEAEDRRQGDRPLWSRHPSLLAFPRQILLTTGLAAAAVLAWKLEWSGGVAAVCASLACFSASLLLWRKTANHLQVFAGCLVIRSGLPWRRIRVVDRDEVAAFRPWCGGAGRWLGLGGFVIELRSGKVVVLRGFRRTRRAARLWDEACP